MIRRWLPLALGIGLLLVSATLHVAYDRRVSWLMDNGTQIVGLSKRATGKNGRGSALVVDYNLGDQRRVATVGCLSAFQTCPTGRVHVWVDPADPYKIAIQGGHLSGTNFGRHWTAGLGLAILGFLAWETWRNRSWRAAQGLRARVASRTPGPGQKPRRKPR